MHTHTHTSAYASQRHIPCDKHNIGLVCLTRLTDVPPLLSLPRPGYWAGRSSLLPVEEKSHRQRIEFHMRVLASSRERGSVQDGHLFSARFFVFLSYNHLFPSFYFLSFLSTPLFHPWPSSFAQRLDGNELYSECFLERWSWLLWDQSGVSRVLKAIEGVVGGMLMLKGRVARCPASFPREKTLPPTHHYF